MYIRSQKEKLKQKKQMVCGIVCGVWCTVAKRASLSAEFQCRVCMRKCPNAGSLKQHMAKSACGRSALTD